MGASKNHDSCVIIGGLLPVMVAGYGAGLEAAILLIGDMLTAPLYLKAAISTEIVNKNIYNLCDFRDRHIRL